MILQIILIIIFFQASNPLTKQHWVQIDTLMKNPSLTHKMREKIAEKITEHYKYYADKKAIEFKKLHKFKCRSIHVDDLKTASRIGLYKASLRYNGNYHFFNYMNIYIKGELLKCMTDYFTITSVPKTERRKKVTKLEKYHNLKLITTYVKSHEEFKYETFRKLTVNTMESKFTYQKIWNEIKEELQNDPFTWRCMILKYDFEFNKIRSNLEISKYMVCSEEFVRKKLIMFKINQTEYFQI